MIILLSLLIKKNIKSDEVNVNLTDSYFTFKYPYGLENLTKDQKQILENNYTNIEIKVAYLARENVQYIRQRFFMSNISTCLKKINEHIRRADHINNTKIAKEIIKIDINIIDNPAT